MKNSSSTPLMLTKLPSKQRVTLMLSTASFMLLTRLVESLSSNNAYQLVSSKISESHEKLEKNKSSKCLWLNYPLIVNLHANLGLLPKLSYEGIKTGVNMLINVQQVGSILDWQIS